MCPRPQLHRLAEPDDRGHVLRAGPPPALVVAAVLDGHHARALPDVERADALRPVDLVRRHRHERDPGLPERHGELAERLDAVDVERDAPLGRDAADLLDRHERAALAVRGLDRDQDRVRAERAAHVVRVHQPLAVHRQVRHGVTGLLQRLAGPEDGVVLDLGRDHVAAGPRARHALDGQVVGLGAARGEDDLLRRDPEEARDALARRVDPVARLPPEAVDARSVAEALREVGQHRRQDVGVDRRRGVVIEIDASHDVPHLVTRPDRPRASALEGLDALTAYRPDASVSAR